MTRKRAAKRKKDGEADGVNSNASTRSNSRTDKNVFISIDDESFTKDEIINYVSELKAGTDRQNRVINELLTKVEQLNDKVLNLTVNCNDNQSAKQNINGENDSLNDSSNKQLSNTNNRSDEARISDDEDDMSTSSVLSELLDTTITYTQSNTDVTHSNEFNSLIRRNDALLSRKHKEQPCNSAAMNRREHEMNLDEVNYNNNNTARISNEHNNNGERNTNTKTNTQTPNGQQSVFLISNPQAKNEPTLGKKFKIDKKKSPEIIVYNINNKKQTLDRLKVVLGHDRVMFRAINKDKTAIITEINADRKKVLEFLDNNYSRYFTYTPSDEKPRNYLLKYIDSSFDETDIRNDILLLNKDIKILKLKVFQTTKPLIGKQIWLLQTENSENVKTLVGTHKLCASIVQIEKLKSSGVLQCKRCQRFEHAASNCHNTYRCVKCGMEENQQDSQGKVIGHKHGECPLNRVQTDGVVDYEKLFCCNCKKSGHPANYTKCEKYIEQTNKKANKAEKAEEKKVMFNNYISSGVAFSDRLKSNPTAKQNSANKENSKTHNQKSTQNSSNHTASNIPNPFSSVGSPNSANNNFIQTECEKYFGDNLFGILSKINEFIPKYKKVSDSQKPIKLLEFLFNLSTENGK